MAYDYVKRAYGVDPKIGQRVRHTVTGDYGRIAKPDGGHDHYVDVRFDGEKHASPCHPTELDYDPAGDAR